MNWVERKPGSKKEAMKGKGVVIVMVRLQYDDGGSKS